MTVESVVTLKDIAPQIDTLVSRLSSFHSDNDPRRNLHGIPLRAFGGFFFQIHSPNFKSNK